MAKAIIGPDENARIRYSVPTGRTIEFDVRANHSVKTYVMTKKGLEEWDNGNKKFKYFGGFQDPGGIIIKRLYCRLGVTGIW